MPFRIPLALATALLALFSTAARAQAPGVPIEAPGSTLNHQPLLEQARVLREAGRLLDLAKVKAALERPTPAAIDLPPAQTEMLSGREIARRARQAHLRIGWHYLCPRCEHWHLNLADAYAIAADGIVATCHHVVAPGRDMREGYLVALDPGGEIRAVEAILARSQTLDAAIVRVSGGKLAPLALNDQVAPGDRAFCFSNPLDQRGYFSEGIVNRFYWRRATKGAPDSLDALKQLRLNVSTDWAPGSSGAAVLDECGNAIGHVSTISPLTENKTGPAATPGPTPEGESPRGGRTRPDRFNGATLITLHEAVPARGMLALIRAMREELAAGVPAPEKPAP